MKGSPSRFHTLALHIPGSKIGKQRWRYALCLWVMIGSGLLRGWCWSKAWSLRRQWGCCHWLWGGPNSAFFEPCFSDWTVQRWVWRGNRQGRIRTWVPLGMQGYTVYGGLSVLCHSIPSIVFKVHTNYFTHIHPLRGKQTIEDVQTLWIYWVCEVWSQNYCGQFQSFFFFSTLHNISTHQGLSICLLKVSKLFFV